MHSYSTDSNERKWIPFILIIISFCTAFILRIIWEAYHPNGILGEVYYLLSFLIDFSVIFFYELYHYIFNNWLWHNCPLVKVPDINGSWKGTLISSYNTANNNSKTTIEAEIKIKQTWLDIEIRIKTNQSTSQTVTAAFFTKNSNSIDLSYQFLNIPKPHAAETLHMHNGTGWITFDEDIKGFEGEYYNGRDSKNHGSINFKKVN